MHSLIAHPFRHRRSWLCLILILLAAVAEPAQDAGAVSINFTYEAGNSNPPGFDTDGMNLMNIMGAAGTLWSDIIEDDWTVNIAVRWEVPSIGNNFSGRMTLYQNHPNNNNGDLSRRRVQG